MKKKIKWFFVVVILGGLLAPPWLIPIAIVSGVMAWLEK